MITILFTKVFKVLKTIPLLISEIEFKQKYFTFHPKTKKIIQLSKKNNQSKFVSQNFNPLYIINSNLTLPGKSYFICVKQGLDF